MFHCPVSTAYLFYKLFENFFDFFSSWTRLWSKSPCRFGLHNSERGISNQASNHHHSAGNRKVIGVTCIQN